MYFGGKSTKTYANNSKHIFTGSMFYNSTIFWITVVKESVIDTI